MSAGQAELEAKSLERLLDVLEALNNVLSDEELLRAVGKLVMTPELFLVIDRLPQLIALVERLSRPETLARIQALLDLIDSIDFESVVKAVASPPPETSLTALVRLLGDRRVVALLMALAGALSRVGAPALQQGSPNR